MISEFFIREAEAALIEGGFVVDGGRVFHPENKCCPVGVFFPEGLCIQASPFSERNHAWRNKIQSVVHTLRDINFPVVGIGCAK